MNVHKREPILNRALVDVKRVFAEHQRDLTEIEDRFDRLQKQTVVLRDLCERAYKLGGSGGWRSGCELDIELRAALGIGLNGHTHKAAE